MNFVFLSHSYAFDVHAKNWYIDDKLVWILHLWRTCYKFLTYCEAYGEMLVSHLPVLFSIADKICT